MPCQRREMLRPVARDSASGGEQEMTTRMAYRFGSNDAVVGHRPRRRGGAGAKASFSVNPDVSSMRAVRTLLAAGFAAAMVLSVSGCDSGSSVTFLVPIAPTGTATDTPRATRTATFGQQTQTATATETATAEQATPTSTEQLATATATVGSPTATATGGLPTATNTRVATRTASATATNTAGGATRTASATATNTTGVATRTATTTGTATETVLIRTPTATGTTSSTPTATATTTAVSTTTTTATITATATSTSTSTSTSTRTSTATATATTVATGTFTALATATTTAAGTATATHTAALTATATGTEAATATVTDTMASTATATAIPTGTASATITATAPATDTATATASDTPTATNTAAANTATATPVLPAADTATETPTLTPTVTFTPVLCPASQGRYTQTTTGGVLKVSTFLPFAFPAGGVTVQDVSAGDSNCVHTTVVPYPGGFSTPIFCVPSLGYTVQVTQTGCGIGIVDSNGGSDLTTTEKGDTSYNSGGCGAPQSCTAFVDSSGEIDITVGDGTPDICASGTGNAMVSIPVNTVTWLADDSSCPDSDGILDAADSIITQFPQTLDLTTDRATAQFADNAPTDSCSLRGAGPAGPFTANQVCAAAGNPYACCTGAATGSCTGSGAVGTCMDFAANTVTVAAGGTVFSSAAPLHDLLFTTVQNSTISAPAPFGGATCASPPTINFFGLAQRCIVAP